ncbi:hypothetical protein RF11_06066 [Thelohanellus kitauei]|uniref:Uncharacterized protein n=1 Tax=Thelohanellus kitauei TaxID=669202 RepID=A0A0C2N2T3_THEKT|nr:hypothetical protein RF11_06066 [Thelohanellus kitauei]
MSKSRLTISFLMIHFLAFIHISLPGFSDRNTICYRAPAWKSFKFKYTYDDKVNFKPPKLMLETDFITLQDKAVFKGEVVRKYVISEYASGCEDQIEFFQFGAGKRYGKNFNSYGFYTFSFGDFIVEHFMIKSSNGNTEANIVGAEARGSMNVRIGTLCNPWYRKPLPWNMDIPDLAGLTEGKAYRITFMNYLTSNSPIHFLPLNGVSLKVPEYAVVDLILVDEQGTAIENVPAIKDLVKIDIIDSTTSTLSAAKLLYSRAFETRNIRVKISDHGGEVRAETIYSLSTKSIDRSGVTKQFQLNGFVATPVTSAAELKTQGMDDKFVRFLQTVSTHGTCIENGSKAFVIKRKVDDEVVYVESRKSYNFTEVKNVWYLSRFGAEKTEKCGFLVNI